MEELRLIQQQLKAPKDLHNKFGGYNYRSCESILEAVKPILAEHECDLVISDDIFVASDRVYLKATATLTNKDSKSVSATAFAREELTKKGMDAAQITGSASSYARKYALNGLFCIDDTKDPDYTNKHDKEDDGKQLAQAMKELGKIETEKDFQTFWKKWASLTPSMCANGTPFNKACAERIGAIRKKAAV